MFIEKLQNDIGGIDLYLLDQILKKRYQRTERILDAGCGAGRNLKWFYESAFTVYGIDTAESRIEEVQEKYPAQKTHFSVQDLTNLQFESNYFHHIICNAVLHFANSVNHFEKMFSELVRVVKPGGSVFIRMTSNIGIEDKVQFISDGVYALPDQTNRFLLTPELLDNLLERFPVSFIEPLKTVNVNNVRCMSTLVLQKGNI
jgi:ubiquinone/menaquinone biosynthesis C-methylase UbiE